MPKGDPKGSIENHRGRCRLKFWVGGKAKRESTLYPFTPAGKKQAAKLLAQRNAEVLTGTYRQPAGEVAVRTFSEFADLWIESISGSRSREGSVYKPSTVLKYERNLRRWKAAIGERMLRTLTKQDIAQASAAVTAGVADTTATNLAIVGKKVLRAAAAAGHLDASIPESMRTPLPPKARLGREDVWSKEEAARLPGQAASISPEFGRFITIALATGMRGGELRALQVSNVHLDARIISVRLTCTEDYTDGPSFGPCKTARSVRDLDIDERLVPVLKEQIGAATAKGSQWLFPGHLDPEKPMTYWALRAWYAALRKLTGRPSMSPHRTRHTFASTALTSGASLVEVAEYMGDSPATVERHYATWADKEARKKAASRFASMYDVVPM